MIGKSVAINIVEVKQPDINAQLVAEKIAHDLEDRISFRRAMKQSIGRAMSSALRVSRLDAAAVLAVQRSLEQKHTTRYNSTSDDQS